MATASHPCAFCAPERPQRSVCTVAGSFFGSGTLGIRASLHTRRIYGSFGAATHSMVSGPIPARITLGYALSFPRNGDWPASVKNLQPESFAQRAAGEPDGNELLQVLRNLNQRRIGRNDISRRGSS